MTNPREGIHRPQRVILDSNAGFINEAGAGHGHRLSSCSAGQPL